MRARELLERLMAEAHTGTAYAMMMLAMLEGMLGDAARAVELADRAVALRPMTLDAVLGGALEGALLIRREPGRLFAYAYAGETERFFTALARLVDVPSTLDPVILRRDPCFAALRLDPRFDAIMAGVRMPL